MNREEWGRTMDGFCPNCEKESPLALVRETEDVNVRGENIPVEVEYYRCQVCGEEFENSKSAIDPYEAAYRAYRARKGLLQPEEIREFRVKQGLTQKELSDLLGIGVATLNRYENGALQSEAHNRLMALSMNPSYFSELVFKARGAMSDAKRERLISQLAQEREASWLETARSYFGDYSADIYSGHKRLDLAKFAGAIKYFCYPAGTVKTKLMKLLFYADMGHFKAYAVSITGARYARLPYGPVPDQFETWLAALASDDDGIRKEEEWQYDYPAEVYVSNAVPDLAIFSPSELRVLAEVKERFQDYTARRISELSHSEKGYQETETGRLIPYSYASQLSIDFELRGADKNAKE